MTIIDYKHPMQDCGTSIFLAGPTPPVSWRGGAVRELASMKFSGGVIVPENFRGPPSYKDYYALIDWENYYLERCSVIAFWMNDMQDRDVFQFGYWLGKNPNKVFLGCSPNSGNTYISSMYYKTTHRGIVSRLDLLMVKCLKSLR